MHTQVTETGGADGTRTRDPRRDRPVSDCSNKRLRTTTCRYVSALFNALESFHNPLIILEHAASNSAIPRHCFALLRAHRSASSIPQHLHR